MAFPAILAAVQGVLGAKEKKEAEQRARREAAARGEALRNVGNEGGGLSSALGAVGGLLGGLGGGEKTRIGGTSGSGMEDALNDVDDALESFDNYRGY